MNDLWTEIFDCHEVRRMHGNELTTSQLNPSRNIVNIKHGCKTKKPWSLLKNAVKEGSSQNLDKGEEDVRNILPINIVHWPAG